MVIPYRSARLACCALKPGLGSLRLTASAIAVAAAIASLPALADGKNKEGKNKSANIGPVVPNITTGVANFNRQANFVVASIPAATNTTNVNNFTPPSGAGPGLSKVETGNSGPGPSALPVTAIGNGAGVKSGGVCRQRCWSSPDFQREWPTLAGSGAKHRNCRSRFSQPASGRHGARASVARHRQDRRQH